MGGTLPALLRAVRPADSAVAPATGLLYAANTVGAVAGSLAVPFLLVPVFGIQGTGVFGGVVGVTVTGLALALDRRRGPVESAGQEPGGTAAERSADARVALPLYAVAVGVALVLGYIDDIRSTSIRSTSMMTMGAVMRPAM